MRKKRSSPNKPIIALSLCTKPEKYQADWENIDDSPNSMALCKDPRAFPNNRIYQLTYGTYMQFVDISLIVGCLLLKLNIIYKYVHKKVSLLLHLNGKNHDNFQAIDFPF